MISKHMLTVYRSYSRQALQEKEKRDKQLLIFLFISDRPMGNVAKFLQKVLKGSMESKGDSGVCLSFMFYYSLVCVLSKGEA